jgi:hypothetical protein
MNRNRKRRGYPAAILAGIILITLIAPLITSCKTTPQIEYIHETPDVIFPVFPSVDSVTYDDETNLVSMPLELWLDIAKYKIDVDAIEEYLLILRGQDNVERMKALTEQAKKKTGFLFFRRQSTGGMAALAKRNKKKTDRRLEGLEK